MDILLNTLQSVSCFAGSNDTGACGKYDYIICGMGTAGTLLARKLSDDFCKRVLVLEAGVNRSNDPNVKNPDYYPVFNILGFDPKYALTYPVVTQGVYNNTVGINEAYILGAGSMWAGSSAHDYMFAVRGTPEIYDEWAQVSGNKRWRYSNLLPLFRHLEHYTSNGSAINTSERGTKGPVYITQGPPITGDAWATAMATGFQVGTVTDYNDPTQGQLGFSSVQFYNTPGFKERSYALPSFLPIGKVISSEGKGLHGRQLQIVSNAWINRIIFDGTCAVGVEYTVTLDGKEHSVEAFGKDIVVTAGGINSPAILQRSGVGPKSLLKSLGVPVVVDSPNVGNNLKNQYGPSALVYGGLLPGADITLFGDNPGIPGFWDGRPTITDGVRRLQIFQLNPEIGAGYYGYAAAILDPKSSGSVTIVSRDPHTNPLIDYPLYTDGPVSQPYSDANLAVTFYRNFQNIVANNLMGTLIYPPSVDFSDPTNAALLGAAKANDGVFTEDHPCCTCRMAKRISDGVVDGKLRVFGTSHLYVGDNSAVPKMENGNTRWTAMTVAAVLADILLETNNHRKN